MLISRCAEIQGVYVVQKLLEKFAVLLGSMYFIWTSGFSLWWYHENYMWEKSVISMAENTPFGEVLEVEESPIYIDGSYGALSGFHLGSSAFSNNENDWKNVSFARYYHIKGIRLVDTNRG